MKRSFIISLLTVLVTLLAVGPSAAQKDKAIIKGEVVSIGSDTLTIETNKGVSIVVRLPAGFDISTVEDGTWVFVEGATAGDGSIEAEYIKLIGFGKVVGDDDKKEKLEEFKDKGAFCAPGKKALPHPLASKMAERYSVSADLVMDYFCDGYSLGTILLAIKTSQMEGVSVEVGALLASRASGHDWGQIWEELNLIGKEKYGHSPYGLLKKPEYAGPKK